MFVDSCVVYRLEIQSERGLTMRLKTREVLSSCNEPLVGVSRHVSYEVLDRRFSTEVVGRFRGIHCLWFIFENLQIFLP